MRLKEADYKKEPWKHPAVWEAHLVRMTRDYQDGVAISVATCQCGWSSRIELGRAGGGYGAGYVAQDDAVDAHWQGVIAAAAGATA